MRHRHQFENKYCNACQCTTRHEVKQQMEFTCLRCGVVKVRIVKPTTVAAPLPLIA
jgi:hypothetical protein